MLEVIAAIGHLHRRPLGIGAAIALAALVVVGLVFEAAALACVIAWLWCSPRAGGMAELARATRRLLARLGRRGLALSEDIADLLWHGDRAIPTAALTPPIRPRLPAAGETLAPKLLPVPAFRRA